MLFRSEEGLRKTPNNLIHIGKPLHLDVDWFLAQLQELMQLAYDGQDEAVLRLVEQIVPTYHRNQDQTVKTENDTAKQEAVPVL